MPAQTIVRVLFTTICVVAAYSSAAAQIWQADPEVKAALRREKVEKLIVPALKETGINVWLVFDRDADDESVNTVWDEHRKVRLEPLSEHLGTELIYQPVALLFTDSGERIAIVSTSDRDYLATSGLYTKILTYEYTKRKGFDDILPLIRDEVRRLNPARIGLNWSELEPMADGLSVGMYKLLERTLGPELSQRFTSAEDVSVSLLGRNTAQEVAYLQQSAEISLQLMQEAMRTIRPGVTTERDIFNYIRFRMKQLGVEPGWSEFRSPIVTVQGPRSGRAPGDEKVLPGRLVKINGGVRVKGFAVDLNMNAYVLREGETSPPPVLQQMWDTMVRATADTIKAIKPGVVCRDVDALARKLVREAGYDEWGYEVGHSVGTWIHGIGPTLAPDWSHFGRKPGMKIQVNDAYAVEPAVERLVPELGTNVRVHVQEMVVVTPTGARYMVPPQTELLLIRADGTTVNRSGKTEP
jgi:Xaa-Pro aminopeptidase